MVGTVDSTIAEVLFGVGNFILFLRIIFSPHIDHEGERQSVIFVAFLLLFAVSFGEWHWVESKRVMAVSNHSNPTQEILIPMSSSNGSGGKSPGGPSTTNGILPPNGVALSPIAPPKHKSTPKPKTPEPRPTPIQGPISPDPYFGVPNSTVATWTFQMANGLSTLGDQCMQDLMAARRQQTDSTHPSALPSLAPEDIQIRFWWAWTPIQKPLAKLHDSLLFRLGPVATIAEEKDYRILLDETENAKENPAKWSWEICQDLPSYASKLRNLGTQLHP